jgi:hypothetical protein
MYFLIASNTSMLKRSKFLKLFTISIYQHIPASGCEKGSDVCYVFFQHLNAAYAQSTYYQTHTF